MSNTEKPDAATEALFKEIDEEAKADYKKCSVVDTLGAVFDCYTLRSQAMNYYRYGTKKNCQPKWDEFKFCCSTKLKSSKEADQMIRERERQKEAQRRKGKSSEDIWEARDYTTI